MAKLRWRRGRSGEERPGPTADSTDDIGVDDAPTPEDAADPHPEADLDDADDTHLAAVAEAPDEFDDLVEVDPPAEADDEVALEETDDDQAAPEETDVAEADDTDAQPGDLEAVDEADDQAAPEEADVAEADDTDAQAGDLEAVDEADEVDEVDQTETAAARPSRLVRWLLGGNDPDDVLAIQLLKAAHAKQAITMALAVAVAAVISGRPAREAAVVLGTVLLGQAILGLHNDIVDRHRDHAHGLTGKPLAMGRLSAETAWYAVVTLFLALLPLSFLNSIPAASWYLGSVVVGMVGNILLRTGFFSWWSWAVSFGMLPFFLSYGGWGGEDAGDPPQVAMVVLAALLGIGVHFMRAVWGLVADHEDNWTYLPLKIGMKIGATRLLALSTLYTIVIVVLIAVAGTQVGLRA